MTFGLSRISRATAILSFAAGVMLVLPGAAGAQSSIDLPGAGSYNYGPFGKPNTQTYGQTFKTPDATNTVLTDFSFWLSSNPDGLFKAYVYAWDQGLGHAVGPALFSSAVMSEPNSGAGFFQVLVNTGGIGLTAGSQYVAFFSTSGLGGSGTSTWQQSSASYADGSFVYYNNGEDFSALTTNTWNCTSCTDVRFNANFSSVVATPEPASFVLLATGLVGVAFVRRRRINS